MQSVYFTLYIASRLLVNSYGITCMQLNPVHALTQNKIFQSIFSPDTYVYTDMHFDFMLFACGACIA